MSERFKSEGAGKGDSSRISDINKFSRNMEKLYEKKTWKFWAAWEGLNVHNVEFDDEGLGELQKISYSEYNSRLKNK